MVPRGVVYLAEDTESVGLGEEIFCATFSGYHGDEDQVFAELANVGVEEALAWARLRADEILIRLADGNHYFAAGRKNSANDPDWPPNDLGPLVRRRPPGEAWRDLRDDAPGSRWNVVLHAHPPTVERRPECDALIRRLASTLGADWSATSLDAAIADIRGHASWTTSHATAYVLEMQVIAPNAGTAERLTRAQVELPADWRLRAAEVVPAAG